jgi:hypothetical protein
MKRITLSIFMLAILLVLSATLVNSASATIVFQAKPNPGELGTDIVFTLQVTGEGDTYLWRSCRLFVDYGDGTSPQIVGRLEEQRGGVFQKVFWHKYSKAGTFRVTVRGDSCDTNPRYLIIMVKINMPKPLILPFPKDRPVIK